MKTRTRILILATSLLAFAGCSSAPVAPTDKQTVIANAVEDTLSIGLVPVLVKNPDYVPVARSVAVTLGAFDGAVLTPADVDAFLAKTSLAPEDARTIAALVNASWDTYARRYAQQVNASVRPDVKLFLAAVANGITRALAALPQKTASLKSADARTLAASYARMADWLASYRRDPGDSMTVEQYLAWESMEAELRARSVRLASL
jgi:hypothetical protein